jgi:hypothetical protein
MVWGLPMRAHMLLPRGSNTGARQAFAALFDRESILAEQAAAMAARGGDGAPPMPTADTTAVLGAAEMFTKYHRHHIQSPDSG